MTREKLKKWCCYYLLLWLGAFICIGVTQLTVLSIRPIVELVFRLTAYFYPVSIMGYSIWNMKDEESFRNICFGIYLAVFFLITVVFILFLILPMKMERRMDCGYLQITDSSNFPDADIHFFAEPKALLFMEYFDWDVEHDIYILEYKYNTTFTVAENRGDGINRYSPFEHPEIAVRVYFRDIYGIVDDYQYQLTSNIALKYYKEKGLLWEYRHVDDYEGNIGFIVKDDDNLEQYAQDLASMVAEALKDPFYKDNVGWLNIGVAENTWEMLAFGDYLPFKENGISPDFYSDDQNVLNELKKWTKKR